MNFSKASSIEDLVWQMKFADVPRANNRVLINDLANGFAPYTDRQVQQNNISVNYNDLACTKLFQDARSQYITAAFSPAQYFAVRVDRGAAHQRDEWSEIITSNLRKAMKHGVSALHYRETLRNQFAQLVAHGVGPNEWSDKEHWCPNLIGMGDIMVPSQTLLTMENLSYFAIYRRYTAYQLWKMTHGPRVDPGWNVETADACIAWALKQYGSTTFGEDWVWSPERIAEDFKENGGQFNSDAVPTINCWDFFHRSDDGSESGWRRKIVLDTPSIDTPEPAKVTATTKNIIDGRNQFLYDGKKRKYADKLSHIIHFQFADGSVVAPFRYQSVRSLGMLLYAICHLQNRLRCSMTEAAFEACLQYFRVSNQDDAQRALKFSLINRGILPDGVNFVGANERWQVNQQLIEGVMAMNRQSLAENSTSYTKDFGYGEENKTDKTATQVTAEVNAASALVGAMLEQWYGLQDFQYQEICRRFCRPNSKDPDVRKFRVNCLKAGVPENILDSECWDISAERILGNGNRQLALGQAQAVMQYYQLLDPDAQKVALRQFMFAATNDASKTELLAPMERNKASDAAIMAAESMGTLMLGLPVPIKEGLNHVDAIETLLGQLALLLKQSQATGLPTPQQLMGYSNVANQIQQHIAILEQDKGNKEKVKQYSDDLGELTNVITALQQQLQQQMEAQAQQGGGNELDPADAVKLKGQLLIAQTKAQNMQESHAQRSQQRAEIHEQNMREKAATDQLSNAQKIRETQVNESAKDLETAATIARESSKPAKALTE